MAHTCPECGQTCYCCGDIDDIDWGEVDYCQHYLQCEPMQDDYPEEEQPVKHSTAQRVGS